MIIQLQPGQISLFWSSIKYAITTASGIAFADREKLLNNAFAGLLEGRYQCWLVYEVNDDGERQIHAVVITSIVADQLFGHSKLYIDYVYGYRKMTDKVLVDGIAKLREFASRSDCREIIVESTIPRVAEILDQHASTVINKYVLSI